MSTPAPTVVDHEPVDAVTPVRIHAASLESTAPEHLRTLHTELAADGIAPVELVVETCFEDDCSMATAEEADRIRRLVRAGDALGVNRLIFCHDDDLADPARSALTACAERARREGFAVVVEPPTESAEELALDG